MYGKNKSALGDSSSRAGKSTRPSSIDLASLLSTSFFGSIVDVVWLYIMLFYTPTPIVLYLQTARQGHRRRPSRGEKRLHIVCVAEAEAAAALFSGAVKSLLQEKGCTKLRKRGGNSAAATAPRRMQKSFKNSAL